MDATVGTAGVGGAGVVVLAVQRRAGRAGADPADLGAIADVAVGAGGAVRNGGADALVELQIAAVGGAGVAVVTRRSGPGRTSAGVAGLGAVAEAAVGAGSDERTGGLQSR